MPSKISEQALNDVRMQDMVARISRVSLRDVCRVIRALHAVSKHTNEWDLVEALEAVMEKGATTEGMPSAIQARPDQDAVNASNEVYKYIRAVEKQEGLDGIYHLTSCPFMSRRMNVEAD